MGLCGTATRGTSVPVTATSFHTSPTAILSGHHHDISDELTTTPSLTTTPFLTTIPLPGVCVTATSDTGVPKPRVMRVVGGDSAVDDLYNEGTVAWGIYSSAQVRWRGGASTRCVMNLQCDVCCGG